MSRRKDNQKAVIFGLMGSKMTHASVLVVSFRVRESVDLGKPEEGESLDLEKVRKTASTAYRKTREKRWRLHLSKDDHCRARCSSRDARAVRCWLLFFKSITGESSPTLGADLRSLLLETGVGSGVWRSRSKCAVSQRCCAQHNSIADGWLRRTRPQSGSTSLSGKNPHISQILPFLRVEHARRRSPLAPRLVARLVWTGLFTFHST